MLVSPEPQLRTLQNLLFEDIPCSLRDCLLQLVLGDFHGLEGRHPAPAVGERMTKYRNYDAAAALREDGVHSRRADLKRLTIPLKCPQDGSRLAWLHREVAQERCVFPLQRALQKFQKCILLWDHVVKTSAPEPHKHIR